MDKQIDERFKNEDSDRREVIISNPTFDKIDEPTEEFLTNMTELGNCELENLIDINIDILVESPLIPPLKIKIPQKDNLYKVKKKAQTIKYGDIVCNMVFSRDPDYRKARPQRNHHATKNCSIKYHALLSMNSLLNHSLQFNHRSQPLSYQQKEISNKLKIERGS